MRTEISIWTGTQAEAVVLPVGPKMVTGVVKMLDSSGFGLVEFSDPNSSRDLPEFAQVNLFASFFLTDRRAVRIGPSGKMEFAGESRRLSEVPQMGDEIYFTLNGRSDLVLHWCSLSDITLAEQKASR